MSNYSCLENRYEKILHYWNKGGTTTSFKALSVNSCDRWTRIKRTMAEENRGRRITGEGKLDKKIFWWWVWICTSSVNVCVLLEVQPQNELFVLLAGLTSHAAFLWLIQQVRYQINAVYRSISNKHATFTANLTACQLQLGSAVYTDLIYTSESRRLKCHTKLRVGATLPIAGSRALTPSRPS